MLKFVVVCLSLVQAIIREGTCVSINAEDSEVVDQIGVLTDGMEQRWFVKLWNDEELQGIQTKCLSADIMHMDDTSFFLDLNAFDPKCNIKSSIGGTFKTC